MRSDIPRPSSYSPETLPEADVEKDRTSEPPASGQLDFLVHRAMILAGGAGAAIALETDGVIICRARSGNAAPDLGTVLDCSSGISGQCIAVGEAMLCADTDSDSRVNAAACHALGVRSIIVLPLKSSGKVIGLLEVLARNPGALTLATTRKLLPLAESIASLYESSEGPKQKLDVLVDASASAEPLPSPAPPPALKTFLSEVRSDSRTQKARIATASLLGFAVLLFAVFTGRELLRPGSQPSSAVLAPALSVQELRRAAELGDSSAQYALGFALQKGDGINKDPASGARWLELAAKHGEANAQYEFANALLEGKGVTRDLVEACAWFTVAAFSGRPVSENLLTSLGQQLSIQDLAKVRYRLGQMFSTGVGVPQDYVAAYAWFALSESAGYRAAGRDKAAIASEMSKQQIAEAKRRASEWQDNERAHNAAFTQSR